MKKKVLFVCIHNSARSQMAEAFVNSLAGEKLEAKSAGIEPGKLNPIVVKAMQEVNIDIAGNKTKSVQDFLKTGEFFDYIITVCDEAAAARCPSFPGKGERLHFSFPDPSAFEGNDHVKFVQTCEIRDAIKERIVKWLREINI